MSAAALGPAPPAPIPDGAHRGPDTLDVEAVGCPTRRSSAGQDRCLFATDGPIDLAWRSAVAPAPHATGDFPA